MPTPLQHSSSTGSRFIIFGATGMVGEAVTHVACSSPDVASILLIVRRPSEIVHPKIRELVVAEMSDLRPYKEQLSGYQACLFCLGTTSLGKDEATYRRITYDLTMAAATVIAEMSPAMTFSYVSGAGTNSSEQGSVMWARIKGKTENDLRTVGFTRSIAFRPAFLKPMKGMKRTLPFAAPLGILYPLLVRLMPRFVGTLQELGQAMIETAVNGSPKEVLEVLDIRRLSEAYERRHSLR